MTFFSLETKKEGLSDHKNNSWEQPHSEICAEITENGSETESNDNDIIIDKIRRKSCHCENCGKNTSFQKKVDSLMIEFQTMYNLKKAERQKLLLQEMEKDKMRSSQILSNNSFIYSFNLFKFIRTT